MKSNSRRRSMVAFSFRFTACLQSLFADESVPHDLSFFIWGGNDLFSKCSRLSLSSDRPARNE
jgi:hypothetical protein